MITPRLLRRMIDEVGCGLSVITWIESGHDTHAAVASFVDARTPGSVLRMAGVRKRDLAAPENLREQAIQVVTSMVDECSEDEIPASTPAGKVLTALLMDIGKEGNGATLAEALVARCDSEVLSLTWDSGWVMNGVVYIKRLGGKYWYCDMESAGYVSPPYDSLGDAMNNDQLFVVNDATVAITGHGLTEEELAELLNVDAATGRVVTLNGGEWVVGENRRLLRRG